jgi:hypothetical protein
MVIKWPLKYQTSKRFWGAVALFWGRRPDVEDQGGGSYESQNRIAVLGAQRYALGHVFAKFKHSFIDPAPLARDVTRAARVH